MGGLVSATRVGAGAMSRGSVNGAEVSGAFAAPSMLAAEVGPAVEIFESTDGKSMAGADRSLLRIATPSVARIAGEILKASCAK